MHFPSDMDSIRGSQAFKVSITMIITPLKVHPARHYGKWYVKKYQSSARHDLEGRKMWESNFLTVFIELRCLSCCCSPSAGCSFHMMRSQSTSKPASQTRGQHLMGLRNIFAMNIDTVRVATKNNRCCRTASHGWDQRIWKHQSLRDFNHSKKAILLKRFDCKNKHK